MAEEDKRRSDGRNQSDKQGDRESGSVNNQGRREQTNEETRSQGNQPPPERPKPKR